VLEDPVPREDWERVPLLRQETGIPIMQDACVRSLDDLRQAITLGAIDLLNLKLTRIGGMTSALAFVQLCQECGVGLSIGCSEDLGPGMASILHFSSIFEDVYSTEGVGPDRLGFDIINEPWEMQNGFLPVPKGPGLGVTFDEERLRQATREKRFIVGDAHGPSTLFWLQCEFNKWYQRFSTLQRRLQRKVRDMRRGW
jgi:L-alanine-DL-glutamate epimerase-like enolase superfamily enzyme